MPQTLHPSLSPDTQVLDVRPILASGKDPFSAIMQAVTALKPGQGLAIRASFEPKPLFAVMASKGFQARSHQLAESDWVVEFLPAEALRVAALRVDVRGQEPPEPMIQILAACENLEAGQTLEAIHDRRPQMLYARLDERGLTHKTEEREDGEFRIFITRPAPAGAPKP